MSFCYSDTAIPVGSNGLVRNFKGKAAVRKPEKAYCHLQNIKDSTAEKSKSYFFLGQYNTFISSKKEVVI